MGAGASTADITTAATAATAEELKAAIAGLSVEDQNKLKVALAPAEAPEQLASDWSPDWDTIQSTMKEYLTKPA